MKTRKLLFILILVLSGCGNPSSNSRAYEGQEQPEYEVEYSEIEELISENERLTQENQELRDHIENLNIKISEVNDNVSRYQSENWRDVTPDVENSVDELNSEQTNEPY